MTPVGNDRFIAGVETSGRANHFRNCTHSREPHEITDVILAFGPLNNLDYLICSGLRDRNAFVAHGSKRPSILLRLVAATVFSYSIQPPSSIDSATTAFH